MTVTLEKKERERNLEGILVCNCRWIQAHLL